MITEAEERVQQLEKQLADLQKTRLTASDMFQLVLQESKTKTKIIILIIVCWVLCVLGIIAGFLWYLTLPEEETVYVENKDGNTAYVGQNMNGDFNYGENNSSQN